jgi:glycosyltransferase involved in cell wall biosynthesis
MVFVFWQNIISIHQKSFLEALAMMSGVDKVLLVVEHELTPVRKSMGWEAPELEGVEVVISPDKASIENIVKEYSRAVHVMGGIRIGSMITSAFDHCVSSKCRIGIMSEQYDDLGYKGILRGIKYKYFKLKFARHISFILAIGKRGVEQYQALGYLSRIVFPWAYFITVNKSIPVVADSTVTRIMYAGRLEEAKGIYRFVSELCATGKRNFHLGIFGSGPDEAKIKALLETNGLLENVQFTSFIKYSDLLEQYKHYDWVVLPSTQKDGWGVVVSEGLLYGLKAICSKKCGVSWVVKDGSNGLTFDWADSGSCRDAIKRMLSGEKFASQGQITAWADNAISGKAGATYFLQIVDSVFKNTEEPKAPWLR